MRIAGPSPRLQIAARQARLAGGKLPALKPLSAPWLAPLPSLRPHRLVLALTPRRQPPRFLITHARQPREDHLQGHRRRGRRRNYGGRTLNQAPVGRRARTNPVGPPHPAHERSPILNGIEKPGPAQGVRVQGEVARAPETHSDRATRSVVGMNKAGARPENRELGQQPPPRLSPSHGLPLSRGAGP